MHAQTTYNNPTPLTALPNLEAAGDQSKTASTAAAVAFASLATLSAVGSLLPWMNLRVTGFFDILKNGEKAGSLASVYPELASLKIGIAMAALVIGFAVSVLIKAKPRVGLGVGTVAAGIPAMFATLGFLGMMDSHGETTNGVMMTVGAGLPLICVAGWLGIATCILGLIVSRRW